MSQRLFSTLFFVLLMVCCTWGSVYADSVSQTRRVDLFVLGQEKVLDNRRVDCLDSPFLVGADGVIAAFVVAVYRESETTKVAILAKSIETEGTDWAKKIMENNGSNWKTQLVINKEGSISGLRQPLAVAAERNIYLLFANYKNIDNPHNSDWDLELAVGRVNHTEWTEGTNKTIEWQTPTSINTTLVKDFKSKQLNLPQNGDSGTAFLTRDGRIVFVPKTKKIYTDGFAIIYLKGKGVMKSWDWSYFELGVTCGYSFFEWEGKLIKITHCNFRDITEVKESTDMGRTWADVVGPLARVWGSLKDGGNFITATIENKTVLLCTQKRIEVIIPGDKSEMHLLFADTNRVYNFGLIAAQGIEVTSHGLVYTNGELFSLHQEWNNGSKNVFLLRLKDELERIKSVLKIWAEKDRYLSRPCNETAPQGTHCITPMPTDGLVGFLSNATDGDIWQDEYLYVNATVRGGTKVDSGFTFRGPNSGAIWSVGKQGRSQRYNFAGYGLTVVATVTIHDVPDSDSPLLTFGGVPNNELPGLWYGKDKKWKVMSRNVWTPAGGWETNKAYRVALMVHNKNFSLYVDGKSLGNSVQISAPESQLLDLGDLFIGGHESNITNSTVSHVTVTNVFLYNRPFSNTGFKTLGGTLGSRDGSVRVAVGSALLFLLNLWIIAALC